MDLLQWNIFRLILATILDLQEIKHLPLPSSIKKEISRKISLGITPQRILQGKEIQYY